MRRATGRYRSVGYEKTKKASRGARADEPVAPRCTRPAPRAIPRPPVRGVSKSMGSLRAAALVVALLPALVSPDAPPALRVILVQGAESAKHVRPAPKGKEARRPRGRSKLFPLVRSLLGLSRGRRQESDAAKTNENGLRLSEIRGSSGEKTRAVDVGRSSRRRGGAAARRRARCPETSRDGRDRRRRVGGGEVAAAPRRGRRGAGWRGRGGAAQMSSRRVGGGIAAEHPRRPSAGDRAASPSTHPRNIHAAVRGGAATRP